MDAKITKTRLSRMLSYDWLKIVAVAVAVIIVWVLIFTMTATRITPAQKFTIISYDGNVSTAYVKLQEDYHKAHKDGVFSHEVIEMGSYDLTTANQYMHTMLQAYMETDDGDVIFAADVAEEGYEYIDGEGKKQQGTYLDALIISQRYYLYDLDLQSENGFFKQMERYLSAYYTDGDFTNPTTLNTEKIKQDFLARIERTGDKRYKTDVKLQAGIQGEIMRIEKYSKALIEFYGYLEEGLVALNYKEISLKSAYDDSAYTVKGAYSINLCPDESKMGKLDDIIAYVGEKVGENGEKEPTLMAKDMNISIFNMRGTEEGFQYEALLYINHVIQTSRTDKAN